MSSKVIGWLVVLAVSSCLWARVGTGNADFSADEYWRDWPTIEVPQTSPPDALLVTAAVWRLDCGEDADPLIGQVVSAAPGRDGRTLLVDRQMSRVLVVGPSGAVECTVGRRGEGPGELQGAYRAFALQDGRIGICGGAPEFTIEIGGTGCIVLLDQDSRPAGAMDGAGDPGTIPVCSVRELRCAADLVLTASSGMLIGQSSITRMQELTLLDPATGSRTVIAGRRVPDLPSVHRIAEQDFYEPFAYGRCDLSPTCTVAFAPVCDRWYVVVRNADGTGFVLDRPWSPIRRTQDQIEAVRQALGGNEMCVAMDNHPAVGRVRWRPGGELWVEPLGIKPLDGAMACFDEFSPTGQLLRRVHVQVPAAAEGDELLVMEDGRFVLLRGFGEGSTGKENAASAPAVVLLQERPNGGSR